MAARVLNPPDARDWYAWDFNRGTWFVSVFASFLTGELEVVDTQGPYSFQSLQTVWELEPD